MMITDVKIDNNDNLIVTDSTGKRINLGNINAGDQKPLPSIKDLLEAIKEFDNDELNTWLVMKLGDVLAPYLRKE